MLAVPVVFTNTVVFLISAVYMGGCPLAKHENLKLGNARTTGPGSINVTTGETNLNKNTVFL